MGDVPDTASHTTSVFFYGLFMDIDVLRDAGVAVHDVRRARLPDYRLVIGERATLVADTVATTEGLVMRAAPGALQRLYAQKSVRDYVAQSVSVMLGDGRSVEAQCYNLPVRDNYGPRNEDYARRLVALARRVGLSAGYVACLTSD